MRSSHPLLPVLLLVFASAAACGGELEPKATTPVAEPTLESSPWVVTLERPPSGIGLLRAQRFANGKLETVILDPSARTVRVFPTDGQGESREIASCPDLAVNAAGERCTPLAWYPEGATLLVQVNRSSLVAWSPDTASPLVIGDFTLGGWLEPRGTRVMLERRPSEPLSILDIREASHPVVTIVTNTDLLSLQNIIPSPDGRWLALYHREYPSENVRIEVVDLRGEPPWSAREIFRRDDGPTLSQILVWSPSNAFLIVDEATKSRAHKRAVRIDVTTGAVTSVDYELGPVPSSFRWSWKERMAPDDRTLAISRDGDVALWPIGAPLASAAKLTGTPEWATISWRPTVLRELRSTFVALCVSAMACGETADEPAQPSTQAPVVGTVKLREGDCMPVTTPERCRIRALATRVEAYSVIRLPTDQRFQEYVVPPGTAPLQTTTSDADGHFSFVLPEGRYTIVTSYEGDWYPLDTNGDNEWAPVEVNAAWLEDIDLVINRATD